MRTFLDGKVTLHCGDSRDVLKTIPDASVDSVVTDPPYALVSIVKRFGKEGSAPAKSDGATGVYARASAGFMGQTWDTGETAFAVEFWAEVLRVLKPGGHVAACCGDRTYHHLAMAIEAAGFSIRHTAVYAYGSGFPKSKNLGDGWGSALKPAVELICIARKPLIGTLAQNVLTHGTGGLNIDGCRVATSEKWGTSGELTGGASVHDYGEGLNNSGRSASSDLGRWPPNLLLENHPDVVGCFPETSSVGASPAYRSGIGYHGGNGTSVDERKEYDSGSAARFFPRFEISEGERLFYTSKAGADDRIASKHPTVKPLALMQWLVRLITPKNGTTLDPFAGTGTTGEAAWREGFRAILIEREPDYQADIARRMDLAANPTKREAVTKTKNKIDDFGPLFAAVADGDSSPHADGDSPRTSANSPHNGDLRPLFAGADT